MELNAVALNKASDLPAGIVGTWVSETRDTNRGLMHFEFVIGANGTLDVFGAPQDGAAEKEFRRHGPYRLDGHTLVTPALNEGLPVKVGLDGGQLLLAIDDLTFRLRRK
jgi:hypothetical protein